MTTAESAVAAEVALATVSVAAMLGLAELMANWGDAWAQIAGLLVAASFVGVPLGIARWRKLPADILAVDPPIWPAVRMALLVAAVVLPIYAIGFDSWHTLVLHKLRIVPTSAAWRGLPEQILVQLGAIAVPEELFFRGYVQGRLQQVWPARRRLLGQPFGAAHVVAALLFALIHLVAVPAPFRLLVFFPGLLFGWLAQRTGSALAAAVLHALCNVALFLLQPLYV